MSVPPSRRRDGHDPVDPSLVRRVAQDGDPSHRDTHRDHGRVSLLAGELDHGIDVQILEIPIGARTMTGTVAPEIECVDHEALGHPFHESHHLGFAMPSQESVTEDKRGTVQPHSGSDEEDAVLGHSAKRDRREPVPLGKKSRGQHRFLDYRRPRPEPPSVTLGSLRLIVFLTDPPPDEVLPAAMLLGTDVKTESLSVDALARLPDLAPELVIAEATTDPERTFGILSALRAAGSMVPVLVVLFPEAVGRYAWQEVADDFVPPNVGEAELRLRLEMIRARRGDAGQGVIRLGPVTINVETYQVIADGRPLDLTYKEFELIRFLAQNPGRVFSRARLLREVWGYDFYGGTRTVDVHVRRLRSKLGPEHEHLIETVRGVGYRGTDQPI